MEIKIFGKSLFEARKSNKGNMLIEQSLGAYEKSPTSKYLPDFYSGWNSDATSIFANYVSVESITGISSTKTKKKLAKKKVDRPISVRFTPKGVYEMKMLNDENFKLNTDPEYVEKQLGDFKDKLTLIKSEEYDMRHGLDEISSIVVRLENRKKYPEVHEFFEQFPYTTTSRIGDLVKVHDNLKLGQTAQFLADMPNEAVKIMKEYNKNTALVCEKQAVFYIIANKEDFKKTDKRRDPILLAQSPFGHFWQILGAWDKEMLFLEEL